MSSESKITTVEPSFTIVLLDNLISSLARLSLFAQTRQFLHLVLSTCRKIVLGQELFKDITISNFTGEGITGRTVESTQHRWHWAVQRTWKKIGGNIGSILNGT